MKDTTSLEVKKPISWYNKKVKTDFKKLFTALTKSAFLLGVQDYKGGIKEFIDAFNAFDLKSDANGLAYRLIINAMVNAANDLVFENRELLNPELQEEEKLYDNEEYVQFLDGLNSVLEANELLLNQDAFKNPRSLAFIVDFCNSFEQWLKYFGVEETIARNISNRLPAYFVMALNDEWRNAPNLYNVLLQKTDTPITGAAKRELEWDRYCAFLEKQAEEPVFGESFGLKQIYVPLRAYYLQKEKDSDEPNLAVKAERKGKKVPFMLAEEVSKWLNTNDARHCIKFISGGPGSGKSSFAKMWCAELAQQRNIRVLFIPLHLFDLQSDIVEAILKFSERTPEMQFSFNPLDFKGNTNNKILFVFDGLDELSQQGKYASEIANNFVSALHAYSQQVNRENKVQALFLITGRELAIQSNTAQYRLEQYVFHLLPYFVDYEKTKEEFVENQESLLEIDQRDIWWQQFSKLKNKNFQKLPEVLNLDRLIEITAQPLLNYLIALSLLREKIQFSGETNLNSIYQDLIEGVHERAYEKHRYKAIEALNLEDFKRILEEIGISAWHGGDVRTTSIKAIGQHIEKSGLKQLMDKFEREAEKGIIRLLTAFYFRQHGTIEGDKTFEFTHKSFGEYLTAVRLVKLVARISDEMELKNAEYDKGWSEDEALRKWIEVTGPTPIDAYLFEFILDEVQSYPMAKLLKWQANLAKLLSKSIREGLPMLEPRQSHKHETKLSRNASEAILVFHSACGRITNNVSKIVTNSEIEFGAWFSTIQNQRKDESNYLGFLCLTNLDLSGYVFILRDFWGSNLNDSRLVGTILSFTSLVEADLQRADLQRADLQEADLQLANLQGANLGGAYLEGANLMGANLKVANLEGANLEGANLQEANLQEANLVEANLQEANLQYSDLKGANLEGANLQEANIGRANLEGAKLQEADVQGANLQGAYLQGAYLQGAKLQGANLQGAYLQEAYLQGAKLQGANLQEAYLQGANLGGADLREANLEGADLQGANLTGTILNTKKK